MKFVVQFENDQEKLDIFRTLLSCHVLTEIKNYGFSVLMPAYKANREKYIQKNPGVFLCMESVVMELLDNGDQIVFVDEEYDEYNRVIVKEDIIKGFDSVPSDLIKNIHEDNFDIVTCDLVLQYILFGEVVFS